MPPNTLPELSANVRSCILCFIASARRLKHRPANPFGSRNYHRYQDVLFTAPSFFDRFHLLYVSFRIKPNQ